MDVSSFNTIAKSINYERPLVVTRTMSMMADKIPGLNVIVCVANTPLTYEDGFMMSRSCATRFAYSVFSLVKVDVSKLGNIVVGIVVQPGSKDWWKMPFIGVVCRIVVSLDYTTQSIKRTVPAVSGDKFDSYHGQKGVITVVDNAKMPRTPIGRSELVMGFTTMIKGGTYPFYKNNGINKSKNISSKRTVRITQKSTLTTPQHKNFYQMSKGFSLSPLLLEVHKRLVIF